MKCNLFGTVVLCLLAILVALPACGEFQDNTDSAAAETKKDLSGTWKIYTASRNAMDITQMMDFTQFRLRLNPDGSYVLENPLPFLVRKNGQWKTDDPQYPFILSFTEEGASEPVTTELYYPVVDGKRRISLTFAPGCRNNTYTYVFVADNL